MKLKFLCRFVAVIAICNCGVAYAQGTGPESFPNDAYTNRATAQNLKTWSQQGKKGGYLSGKVALEAGVFPPISVEVRFTCNGAPRLSTSTDLKGSFYVFPRYAPGSGPGQTNGKPQDTFESFAGCTAQAALPGFRSDSITVPSRGVLDSPEIGTILLHRLEGVEGTAISKTDAAAPKDARNAFAKALAELGDNKPERAEKDLQKAVQVYPQYVQAWYELGTIQATSDVEAAKRSYGQAIAADAKFVPAFLRLAEIASQQQNWQEAVESTEKLLALNAETYPEAWYHNGFAQYHLGKKDIAEKSALQGIKVDLFHAAPGLEQLLAVILAEKQDYAGAAEHLRNYLKWAPDASDSGLVRQQLAEIEKVLPQSKQK